MSQRGDEIIVPVQIAQVDEHVQGRIRDIARLTGMAGEKEEVQSRALENCPPLNGKALDLSREKS